MKTKILTTSFLILAFSQTACLTTVHTRPYHHDENHHGYHHRGHSHERTVRVTHPRRVHVPVYRPARTTVTVRRY